MGNNVPPTEDPTARRPKATPRLRLNQWAITAVEGLKQIPDANYRLFVNKRCIDMALYTLL